MAKKYKHENSIALYKRLLSYIFCYWPAFAIAMAANVLYSGIDAGVTYMLKPILNKGFIARDVHFIKFLPFLVLGAFLLRGFANIISNYFMAVVARSVIMRFRQEIFRHLLRLPAKFYDNTSSGQILSTIIYNVEQVANAGSDALTTLVQSFCLIIGLIIVMFSISWVLSSMFIITIPVIAISVHLSSRRLRRISMSLQDSVGEVSNIAEEAVEGYKVVRAFGGQAYEAKKFNKATRVNKFRDIKATVTKAFTVSGVQLIAAIVLAIIIYLATSDFHFTALSAGSFVAMIAAMMALLKPLKDFTNVNTKIQRGLAGAQSVFELLDEEVEQDTGTVHVERVNGEVKFTNVSFRYPSTNKLVLDDINFTVEPGKTVALVGQSGSGKTTIVNLLQRFYDGAYGSITIDDINITDYVLSDLREQFAIVSQHVTLFNDTIKHNIAYGHFAKANDTDIIKAAKAANAWEFIKDLPNGLDTLVGENGVLLSGGQRQRLAIARAILKDAPILVLDEATSALDSESERQIQKALEHLMQNRTTLVIAHRLSTIEKADQILVLEHGRIVEQGPHKDLLDKKGFYSKLHSMQFSG